MIIPNPCQQQGLKLPSDLPCVHISVLFFRYCTNRTAPAAAYSCNILAAFSLVHDRACLFLSCFLLVVEFERIFCTVKWRFNQCAAVAKDLVVTVCNILFSLACKPFAKENCSSTPLFKNSIDLKAAHIMNNFY